MRYPEQTFYYVSFVDHDGPRVLTFTGQRWNSDGAVDWITRETVNGETVTRTQSWPGEAFDTVEEAVAHQRAKTEREIRNMEEEIEALKEQLKVTTMDRVQLVL